ncbi:MAG TPA: YggS family pyridoxal phosphate-dependent enzyme [Candidatus Limnocylindrales bacterium]|nr:YggS family pyridoxal phosphate-dependent enzyme [Candidatus Limnocylindrales bacterium]
MLERIAAAARRAGRNETAVQLVAVSKGVSAGRLVAARSAGIRTFGENRVQEAEAKIPVVAVSEWHLIGHLQSNKARRAVELFDVVESVDSAELATRLATLALELRNGRPLPIYLQVNVDRVQSKAGLDPDDLPAALATIGALPALELRGLMTVGRLVDRPEDARPTFRRLRELSESLSITNPRLGTGLSMGMSTDFEVAVEEGATVVRVGRALFGERPNDR